MRLRHVLPSVLGILLTSSVFASETVTSVVVPGSNLHVNLATQVGQPFDEHAVERDVRYLWSLGRFEDVRVEASERDGGVALIFRTKVIPIRMLRQIRIEPNTFGLDIKLPRNTPIDLLHAHEIALGAQRQLNQQGYQNARVQYELKPAPLSQADLRLQVDIGDDIKVKAVHFDGDAAARGDLRALRARRMLFWRWLPAYNQEAVDADIARIRSSYLAKGFLDAEVRPGPVEIHGKDAEVTIVTEPGEAHAIDSYLCSSLLGQRREAQGRGILDFQARLERDRGVAVELGRPYRVGRIEFTGNHHYQDATIRRNFLLEEGQVFDEQRLRRSIARLNRTSLFENVDAKNVVVQPDEKTGLADVTVRLTERKGGAWRLSGPVGPASLAGPLRASLSSRLPPWGRGLLELSTYTVSVSLLAFAHPILPILDAPKRFVPVLALERPYGAGEGWKSGFVIAPQLGWRNTGVSYVTAQLQQRLLPLVSGERSAEPDLNVTVERPDGDVMLACEAPRPRLGLLRATAGMAIRLLGALPTL